jgi:hypothetical protein
MGHGVKCKLCSNGRWPWSQCWTQALERW